MTPARHMARNAPASLAPLALAILCGCAHQQTPPAPSPPTATAVPPAPSEARSTPAPPSTAAASPTPAPSGPAAPSAAAPAGTRAAPAPPAHAAPPRRPATVGSPGAGAASSAPAGAAATAAASAASPSLDLASLEQRLRDTHAIGVFTKLSLKNQVDDLLAQFRDFYAGKGQLTLAQLRRTYELLLIKVVTLLQNDDPGLASAVSSSREAIWGILSNRTSFNNL